MDTTEKLNKIVDYIESHITEEIDFSQLAKIACLSTYDVNRMFFLVADLSISEYIRKRRMTLAGYDLKYGHAKVIDTSVKYGYDSPVSFTRAFLKFHGAKPSDMKKRDMQSKVFPKMIFQICVKEVITMIRKDNMMIDGKEYEAAYFGEADMSAWSEVYSKREFWRLENAYNDFKNKIKSTNVLPYSNYPPMDIKVGQVFVIDYKRKTDDQTERKYYISDGTVWKGLPSTVEVMNPVSPLKIETIRVDDKDYPAEYFGAVDISSWSEKYDKREFWRLQGINGDFDRFQRGNDVLPYNNYPPIAIEIGDVFVIQYTEKDGARKKTFYIADGTVWQGMSSTREMLIEK